MLSYSQAEPGRGLTQPSPRLLAEPCILSVELCGKRQPGSEGEQRKRRRRKKDENGDEEDEGDEDDEEVKERMGELGLKADAAAGEAEVSINLVQKHRERTGRLSSL